MRAVIMGGTSGIGLAAAEMLTARDIEVTVMGRDQRKLDLVADRVAQIRAVDGTDRAAVAAFFEEFGQFEHLVLAFSPGPVGVGPFKSLGFGDVEIAVSQKVLPYLNAVQQADVTGSITMISASGPRAAVPGTVAISAANGAIERLISPLAAELAPVRVNAVAPGVIDTGWWSFLPEAQRQARFAEAVTRVPMNRIGTSADVAKAIVYLIDADYVTSTIMPVDGGLTVAWAALAGTTVRKNHGTLSSILRFAVFEKRIASNLATDLTCRHSANDAGAVPIPRFLADKLAPHPHRRQPEDLVFTSGMGGVLRY